MCDGLISRVELLRLDEAHEGHGAAGLEGRDEYEQMVDALQEGAMGTDDGGDNGNDLGF